MQVHAFTQAGSADFGLLNLRREIFTGESQDREH